MYGNSKIVTTNQAGIHKNLEGLVKKHINSTYQKPISDFNLAAFEQIKRFLQPNRDWMLDSCCGTGMSTISIAKNHPDALVIGIDQSDARLTKKGSESIDVPPNCLLLRAHCEDIWRLCVRECIVFKRHTLFYPNPWPKSVHLSRRWHGHAVFPYLNPLSTCLTLRSNWKTYLEEFALAWHILVGVERHVEEVHVTSPVTLFEKKYVDSGQAVYQWSSYSAV